MKHKQKELDVDFIGGQGPLTKEEERAISDYLKKKRLQQARKYLRSTNFHSQKRATA
jgi:hypothetical protein